jgi:hypothetical protein
MNDIYRINSDRYSGCRKPEVPIQHIEARVVILHQNYGSQHRRFLFMLKASSYNRIYLAESLKKTFRWDDGHLNPLGDVASINKNSRIILLLNGDIIYYKHLVIVSRNNSTTKPGDKHPEFGPALHALLEALTIKEKELLQFTTHQKINRESTHHKVKADKLSPSIKINNEEIKNLLQKMIQYKMHGATLEYLDGASVVIS